MAKVLVSFDDDLLRRIDRIAAAHNLSRSAYLADLARAQERRTLGQGSHPAARQALVRLEGLLADVSELDSTEAIRAERRAR